MGLEGEGKGKGEGERRGEESKGKVSKKEHEAM